MRPVIELPVLERLEVRGYGLYPGTLAAPDLDVVARDGLTLVLGTNGLGKTTLVLLLYRMLTGPWDIPGLAERAELGNLRLDAKRLTARNRAVFADRVVDGAREATA